MPFDAVQFCKDYNIDYRTSGKNVSDGWVGINDPYTIDTSYHLGINLSGAYTYSWKTGGHSLLHVIKTLLGVDSRKAQSIIDEYSQDVAIRKTLNKRKFNISTTPTEARHRNFLRSRGFNAKYLVEKYDLRSDGDNIVIPIYYHNEIVSYQTRNIYKKQYKMCSNNEAIIPTKDILYNLDNCKKDYIIIVEGVFDVFRLGDDSASTFGTSYTTKQLSILSENYKYVIIMFDNEKEAQKQARKLGAELTMLGTEVLIEDYLQICGVKDAGELTSAQAKFYKQGLSKSH